MDSDERDLRKAIGAGLIEGLPRLKAVGVANARHMVIMQAWAGDRLANIDQATLGRLWSQN